MLSDVVTLTAAGLSGGVTTWLGNVFLSSFRSRDRRYEVGREADLKLEEHRDGLTFQLLEAARVELSSLRGEVERLRPMESHLLHFEEALANIELLLFPGERSLEDVQRQARAFLNRMRRMQEAKGTISNEVQRIGSSISIEGRRES